MRYFLVLGCLLATTSAYAEPASEHTGASRAAYFAPGMSFGSVGGHTAVGAQLDAGVHVEQSVWLHAGVSSAIDGLLLFDGQGSASSLYAGFELSNCPRAHVCAYLGGDVGYARSTYTTSSWGMEGSQTTGSDGMVGVARLGLDIGGRRISWRPGIDVTVGSVKSAALTQSIAVGF